MWLMVGVEYCGKNFVQWNKERVDNNGHNIPLLYHVRNPNLVKSPLNLLMVFSVIEWQCLGVLLRWTMYGYFSLMGNFFITSNR